MILAATTGNTHLFLFVIFETKSLLTNFLHTLELLFDLFSDILLLIPSRSPCSLQQLKMFCDGNCNRFGGCFRQVNLKSEAVESVKGHVQRMKDGAQTIVDNIELDKCEMTNKLDGADPSCEELKQALWTIQPSDVDNIEKQQPSAVIQRIMDCVLIMFQRPVNTVDIHADSGCLKPSWNESVKVRHLTLCQHVTTVLLRETNEIQSKLKRLTCVKKMSG